jgi:valyl-tRNA synthetase
VNRLFESYQYGEAGRQIHDFFWGDFADWYLELAKVQVKQGSQQAATTLQLLLQVLDTSLRFLHPFMPYVTEETWQNVKRAFQQSDIGIQPEGGWPSALIIASWPVGHGEEEGIVEGKEFERIRELIRAIRAIRSDYGVDPAKRIPAVIRAEDKKAMVESQMAIIAFLARLDEQKMNIIEQGDAPAGSVTVTVGGITAFLPLVELVDIEKERERLAKEIQELEEQIQRVGNLLGSDFSKKAPEQVVAREAEKLARYKTSHNELVERFDSLAEMG